MFWRWHSTICAKSSHLCSAQFYIMTCWVGNPNVLFNLNRLIFGIIFNLKRFKAAFSIIITFILIITLISFAVDGDSNFAFFVKPILLNFFNLVASDVLYWYLIHVYWSVCFTAHSRQTRLLQNIQCTSKYRPPYIFVRYPLLGFKLGSSRPQTNLNDELDRSATGLGCKAYFTSLCHVFLKFYCF